MYDINIQNIIMIDFIQNPWTIGIGGGLISGLLVFFFTNKIFSRKENKEYQQRLNSANNELLYAIRPLIVSKQVPNKNIIEALIIATSRKFNVKDSDLHDAKNIADSLTKEILDNPFLDSENKLNYCDIIQNMRNNENVALNELKKEIVYVDRNTTLTKEISLVLAIVSTVSVMFSVISMYGDYSNSYNLLLLVFTATTIPIVAIIISMLLKSVRKKHEYRNKELKIEIANKEDIIPEEE